jgi:hypothetical protein
MISSLLKRLVWTEPINPVIFLSVALKGFMTVTVLDRTWEIEVWPASAERAPNAVYIEVKHNPRYGDPNLLPAGIRFGLTEAEVNRIAHALIEAATGNRARTSYAAE